MANTLRRRETEYNLRESYTNQAEQPEQETQQETPSEHTSNPAPAAMNKNAETEQSLQLPLDSIASSSQQEIASSSRQAKGARIESPSPPASRPRYLGPYSAAMKKKMEEYPILRYVTAEDYIFFVEYTIEEAIWWLEQRLVFETYTSVPEDAFKDLFDDPDEGLPGYGFLTEERNKRIVNRGFFDILSNYAKRAAGTEPPPPGFLRPGDVDANAQPAVPAAEKRATKLKKFLSLSWGKKAGENKKSKIKPECDRIGNLLMGAGYRPNPANTPTVEELHRGDYPDPEQYHADVQVFLELISCLILATCPLIMNILDILDLTFVNKACGEYRTLRYENGHLVIISRERLRRTRRIVRTIIPNPLSRLILVFLIDIRPFIALINTDKTVKADHWHQEYLFPATAGGSWPVIMMNTVLETQTKKKLGLDHGINLAGFVSLYINLNLNSELGDGWLSETTKEVEESGTLVLKRVIKWSREPPGGERYLIKHFETR
ncbi:hypothetical protein TWF718_002856 [Orbilia javanica]|uniref:Uncharacterized protein n=1 Tax=Orbilia javanica TaxID=47235 RepID=A0AAN8NL17_9PEZI